MLALSCLAVFWSGPAQTYGVSVFVDPMLQDFSWSRSLFSTLYSAGTLVSAGVLVLAGRQIDRVGNRLIFVIAAALFGATMLFLSTASGIVAVLLGFACLRSFGSGVLTLGARTLIPHWFHTRAGRAFSILGLAAMASQAIIPTFNNALIERFGWHDAWRINGLIIWIVVLPALALFVRNRPEDVGQQADGRPSRQDAPPRPAADTGATLGEALRTPTFWCLIGASDK
ncbi:MAG: MFS transporter [Thermomicrobiales bacterium]|nr:MFS transporter [Thermomicrobiales bacterium]